MRRETRFPVADDRGQRARNLTRTKDTGMSESRLSRFQIPELLDQFKESELSL